MTGPRLEAPGPGDGESGGAESGAGGVLQHATCVALNGRGILIMGSAGSGKSTLALRLIDRGAMLVADDYALITRGAGGLVARPPARIAGLIEVRGMGIFRLPYRLEAPIALSVRLGGEDERLPEPKEWEMLGVAVPLIVMDALRDDSPLKVEMALSGGPIPL
ncbi:HPr kinase/phosphorylase [Pedomonas sp. V897]|uniref:HPr kinase/phosphorylase n=1 Tax=Pedomonas sp. V897 TaxID=3446482 RepID=UPI003EE1BF5D